MSMKIFTRSFFTIILLCSISVDALGSETDRLALLEFKASISDDPRGILSSWNDSVHFCEWRGIGCSGTRRVTILDLSGHSLRGHVSPFLGNLSSLMVIDLVNNSFSGKIPPELGRLSRLQHLGLADNVLQGEIPANLSRCSELRKLILGPNNLTGKIPPELRSLTKLEMFDIESNGLTGNVPNFLGNMSSLREIYLLYNNLTGTIPDEIGRLKNLSVFSVGPNDLYGKIPLSFYNSSSLTSLALTNNHFHGEFPVLNLPNLIEFYVAGNRFSGEIPASLSNSSRLLRIDVSDNEFTGRVPVSLGKLPVIGWLLMNNNMLGGDSADHSLDFIESLTNCSELKVVSLGSNNFSGVLPRSIANLSAQMTHIYLGKNRLSGRIDDVKFENLPNLIVVSMGSNDFTGEIPFSLTKQQSLRVLDLQSNAFTGKIPSSIGNLTEVFALYLQDNRLEGVVPSSIGECRSLQFLDISDNELTGEIPKEVFGVESLISVNFSSNSLSGEFPGEVRNLKQVSGLDFSENDLGGEIPGAIGDCESLEYLFLQGNSLQGRLPRNLASLQGLRYLDLSRNNLSGKIPVDLEKLTGLISFNISFNNLEGELPNGSMFQNATVLSLIGNANLCGGASELKLPKCSIAAVDSHRGKSHRMIIIAVCLGVVFLLFSIFALFYIRRRLSRRKPASEEEGIRFLSKVSYQTLYEATSGFSTENLIGAGSFGSVYKGNLDGIESPVAIKVLNLGRKGAEKSFLAECEALRNVKHRNLVKVLTCCSSVDHKGDDFKALVFEHMSNGSLDNWLHREASETGLNMIQRLNIGVDVALAIQYLHEGCDEPVIHCDLKPGNVLLDEEMTARVCDFGLARLISEGVSQGTTSGIKGTIGYAAPEYAMGGKVSKSGDVYSYGMLLLELFTGKRPTDDMFRDDFNLRSFVQSAFTEKVMQVVDKAMEITTRSHHNDDDEMCLASVLKIGIACSEDTPSKRMRIGDVTRELQRLRNDYYG